MPSGFLPGPSAIRRRRGSNGLSNGLLNNLVAYWPLNEAGGANNALDLHTNGLTLTQNSSPGADTGIVYATARTFDGSADYFSRASSAALQTGDVDFTLAAWVMPAGVTGDNKTIIYKGGANNAIDYYLDYSTYLARFRLVVTANGSTEVWTQADIFGAATIGAWYLVIGWHDSAANTINIAVNGGAADSAPHSTGVYAGTGALAVGWSQAYNKFSSGRIGPVAMWKSAAGGGGVLSEAQRSALWNGGAGLAYAAFTA